MGGAARGPLAEGSRKGLGGFAESLSRMFFAEVCRGFVKVSRRGFAKGLETPVNTPTPSTTQNKTMLRPMCLIHGLLHISRHYSYVGHWSQSGLVWGWGCLLGLVGMEKGGRQQVSCSDAQALA